MAGINFPQSSQTFFPGVPESLKDSNPELFDYLTRMQLMLQQQLQGQFSNDAILQGVINKGTSGTFAIASGGHILVTSGIVTSVSTT